jgi:hypothetical protein
MPDFTTLTDSEIERYVAYHRPQAGLGSPDYLAAVEEREKRQGGGLNFGRTFEIVRQAAAEGRFLSSGEVAEHSGLTWNAARRPMPKRLGNLCEYAHRRGWPLLSSIVVNKENLAITFWFHQSGEGPWVFDLRRAGIFKGQQHRVFEWGQGRSPQQV